MVRQNPIQHSIAKKRIRTETSITNLINYFLRTSALSKNHKDFKTLNGLSINILKRSIYDFIGKMVLKKYRLSDQSATRRILNPATIYYKTQPHIGKKHCRFLYRS